MGALTNLIGRVDFSDAIAASFNNQPKVMPLYSHTMIQDNSLQDQIYHHSGTMKTRNNNTWQLGHQIWRSRGVTYVSYMKLFSISRNIIMDYDLQYNLSFRFSKIINYNDYKPQISCIYTNNIRN